MTGRSASSTAVLVCQGRAVADGRYAAARFADPVARALLDPPEQLVVDRVRAGQVPTLAAERMAYEMVRHVGITMVPRTIAADLTREPLGPALDGAGFDRTTVTTWVWEGVVPYLRSADVRATVAQIADLCAPGSRLIVSYQAKSLPISVMRHGMRMVQRLSRQPDPMAGEPWRSRWRPDGIRRLLQGRGFDVTFDADLLTLSAGLHLPAWSNASLRNGRVMLATRREGADGLSVGKRKAVHR